MALSQGRAGVRDRASEERRLAALRRTGLLDSPPEPAFDRLTRLAARVLSAPVALISLVDADRQFFKSQCGLPEPLATARQTPLSHSFCQHVAADGMAFVVEDAREHPLVHDNPAVAEFGVIAYLGVPLCAPHGQVLGSFCVIDSVPRAWTDDEVALVHDLAAAAAGEVALRHELREGQQAERQRELLLAELNHRVKNTLAVVGAIARQTGAGAASVPAFVEALQGRLRALSSAHELLTASGWRRAGLAQLVRETLEPHTDWRRDRLLVEVDDIPVGPDLVQSLALLLHELATNAAKYGALSTAGGSVRLAARTEGGELLLSWEEQGGPAVTAPKRSGFGTTLIERVASHQHRGEAEFDWRPTGLVCRVRLSLHQPGQH